MLLHRGGKRTRSHDLKLAVLLSFAAGVVNVCGFLSFGYMTTNVTGYLPGFVLHLSDSSWNNVGAFFLLIFSFFFGAFFSHFILELQRKFFKKIHYTAVLLIQGFLLFVLAFNGDKFVEMGYGFEMVLALLFLMGLQNSLVTFISSAVVRTTHVTGIFTDLGIESAKVIFNLNNKKRRKRLLSNIALKLAIVISFAFGGFICVIYHPYWSIHTLYIACIVVLFASGYDYLKIKMLLVIQQSREKVLKHITIKREKTKKNINFLKGKKKTGP